MLYAEPDEQAFCSDGFYRTQQLVSHAKASVMERGMPARELNATANALHTRTTKSPPLHKVPSEIDCADLTFPQQDGHDDASWR